MALDEAYNYATDTDEGLPDPVKDQVVKYMTEKYNLSEMEQKVLRKLLPGTYDAARFGGKKLQKIYKSRDGDPDYLKWLKAKDADHSSKIPEVLFHETDAASARKIGSSDLQPKVGKITSDAYAGEAEEVGAEIMPLTFFGSDPKDLGYVVMKVMEKTGKNSDEITWDDIRKHGALYITKQGDGEGEVRDTFYRKLLNRDDPKYTGEIFEQYTGDAPKRAYDIGGEELDSHQFMHIEPGDVVTDQSVTPTAMLTGDELVDFLRRIEGNDGILGDLIGREKPSFKKNWKPKYEDFNSPKKNKK
ncbi:MAG TPA: hypothetical protein V6C65_26285 [Allocoleopsis sp.]